MLDGASGIEFDHINFGRGRVRMIVEEDTITVEIRLGAFVRLFENQAQRLVVEEGVDGIN